MNRGAWQMLLEEAGEQANTASIVHDFALKVASNDTSYVTSLVLREVFRTLPGDSHRTVQDLSVIRRKPIKIRRFTHDAAKDAMRLIPSRVNRRILIGFR